MVVLSPLEERIARVRLKASGKLPDDQSAPLWKPQPGPQLACIESPAQIKGYGGAAGGGKTDLLLGCAFTKHRKSIIFRREYPQLRDVIERGNELCEGYGRFNSQSKIWRLQDGRTLELGAVQYEQDKNSYKGRPHDLKAFDELPEFSESQFRFLSAWNRTTLPGQKCEIVCAFNPPTNAEGEWVIRFFGPWLDPQHPSPAASGELRWYAVVDGKEQEVENGAPFDHKGEIIEPKSRTFFPARLIDNPYLYESGYGATLQNLPEPLRSQLLYGDFTVGREDDPWQVIPTEWIRLAQQRWTENPPHGSRLDALGVDVARGGKDKTAIAPRYGKWFGNIETFPGQATPNGMIVAGMVAQRMTADSIANVDVIGVGASTYDILRDGEMSERVEGVNFAEGSKAKDKSGKLGFRNIRAEAYWSFREALDPDTGDGIALPPDAEMVADLCAPKWKLSLSGIQIEAKEDIEARIGRSPDKGDAIVLAAYIKPRRVLEFA